MTDLLVVDGAGINLFPVNLVEALKNRKVQIGIAAVAVLLAVALTLVWVLQPKNDNSQAGATASSSGTADGAGMVLFPHGCFNPCKKSGSLQECSCK